MRRRRLKARERANETRIERIARLEDELDGERWPWRRPRRRRRLQEAREDHELSTATEALSGRTLSRIQELERAREATRRARMSALERISEP